MTPPKLAIIGGGNMGRALVGGLLRRGIPAADISVADVSAAARDLLSREFGVAVHSDAAAAAAGAALVVLAVKPQDAGAVAPSLAPVLRAGPAVLLSVAAGIRTQALEAWCGPGVPVVRAMPNRPALVGAGATGMFAPAHVGAEHRAAAEDVMRAVGEVVWVTDEDALDVVTALSGSGPAYFFLLAELMAQAAIDLGLEPAAARTLAVETLYGSGLLARAEGGDLARLRAAVVSRGGTTEAALRALDEAGFRDAVARALAAATARGRELAALAGPAAHDGQSTVGKPGAKRPK